MTTTTTADSEHTAELLLRRYRAGELADATREEVRAHAEGCAHCRTRLRELEQEQRSFEQEISFERFSAGVIRAARQPVRLSEPRTRYLYPLVAAAAMVSLVVAGGPLKRYFDDGPQPITRTKGGAGMDVRISRGSDGPQRSAIEDAPEPLGPGERVRIGYRAGTHGYVLSVSVDKHGIVTPLYPESGASLPVARGATQQMQYLPESLEFTGSGAETVLVVLSDAPLEVREVEAAARRAFKQAGGDVTRLRSLEVGGGAEVFARTVIKP